MTTSLQQVSFSAQVQHPERTVTPGAAATPAAVGAQRDESAPGAVQSDLVSISPEAHGAGAKQRPPGQPGQQAWRPPPPNYGGHQVFGPPGRGPSSPNGAPPPPRSPQPNAEAAPVIGYGPPPGPALRPGEGGANTQNGAAAWQPPAVGFGGTPVFGPPPPTPSHGHQPPPDGHPNGRHDSPRDQRDHRDEAKSSPEEGRTRAARYGQVSTRPKSTTTELATA